MDQRLTEYESYEDNRDFGLKLCRYNDLRVQAEPYILKALSLDPPKKDLQPLLVNLLTIKLLRGDYDGAIETAETLHKQSLEFEWLRAEAYSHAGDFDAASEIMGPIGQQVVERARNRAKKRNEPISTFLFPASETASRFGELALRLDMFVKACRLGLTGIEKGIFAVDPAIISNESLLSYWAEQADDCLHIIRDKKEAYLYNVAYRKMHQNLDWYTFPDGKTLHRYLSIHNIQQAWEDQQRPPVLSLSQQHRREGWQRLQKLGMRDGDWFVALHVRETKQKDQKVPSNISLHRNSPIEDYVPLIEAVTDRGGWVVRLGGPDMTPLPDIEHVIDYALIGDEIRSDWMDLFLISQCRFLVGSPSGPFNVAIVFGVPVVGVNWFPFTAWPHSRQDLFIHARLRCQDNNKLMSIAEMTAPPITISQHPVFYENHRLDIIKNDPDDIANVAIEMLDRLEGRFIEDDADEQRQRRYKQMAQCDGVGFQSRVGRDFLRRHPHLIEDPHETEML